MIQLIAMTPAGQTDPAIAIAACRAGGIGILDLEFATDPGRASAAVDRLARFAGRGAGVRLDADDLARLATVVEQLPDPVEYAILTATAPEALPVAVRMLREQSRRVWLEVGNDEQAKLGERLGVDGLVAKGQESGGWVDDESTFILVQRLLKGGRLPIWARGGIGLHTAAGCAAAGVAGVVLDAQLALTKESTLPEAVRSAIATMDGSETTCLGGELGRSFRVYHRPGLAAVAELGERARGLAADAAATEPERRRRWSEAVEERVGWGSAQAEVWPIGQDGAFAAALAARYRTVAGVFDAIRQAVATHTEAARKARPLAADSPMARSHGTQYPIVQGPMTRVSDRAEFAAAVAEGGGLPFLALALMRGGEADVLLKETRDLMGDRPWGVGILGFVPLGLRQEQLEVVRRYRPPFALIAGGRPDQARSLESDGIQTYLHVPSPGLLKLFLQDGARRFVFEGRECGGHVGPRSSFVLWESMIEVLLEHLPAAAADEAHVLFAGGVHDGPSAAIVAAMAATLADRGVRVGVLLGTSYLFTREAVSTGAILEGFQQKAIDCRRTVLVESGPGHAVRCVANPYTEEFDRTKRELIDAGKSADEVRQALEELNIGRLRLASKGIVRATAQGAGDGQPKYVQAGADEQHAQGMYMIGQLASLRDRVLTIAELHDEVAAGSTRLLADRPAPAAAASPPASPSRVAIVGMSCVLPGAADLGAYWDNMLNKVYSIGEIPADRWDWRAYFDPDPQAPDKIYSRWGGFLDDVPFDPIEFGMPPNSLPSIDPMHLLALKVARDAIDDADYLRRPFDRSRASVILGASGGSGELGGAYNLRSGLPLLFGDAAGALIERAGPLLPEWTEDSFAGLLLNVAAGRIANRFDLGGVNYTIDAACASSLAAVHSAVRELETHHSDLVIVGGVDTVQTPFGYLCFSKTHALSPTGRPRTFDAAGDGITISEGVVMLVLKRLDDAERDGDRIYAVIQGIAGSSDGRAKGLTAPRPEGQRLALDRAYAKSGVEPTTVGLFEAHGTGTAVGDRTEALALTSFLEDAGARAGEHALGSVKSMIGHTKATAGVAGLAKVALALYHKVLPPTLGVTRPNPKARLDDGPLYVNAETRPWVHAETDRPRRAGVSAFGFGGTNFHAVVEEYTGDYLPRPTVTPRRPSELLLWSAENRSQLLASLDALAAALEQGAEPALHDLAFTLAEAWSGRPAADAARLAIVAGSLDDLRTKLATARARLAAGDPIADPQGIVFSDDPIARTGRVAWLFPGQGSQYPDMLRDLAVHFDGVRATFERFDRALAGKLPQPLSRSIFPKPAFGPELEAAHQAALARTDVAQPALGAAEVALLTILGELRTKPDLVAGHSYGEYVALHAAGAIDEATLAILSEARGRSIVEAAGQDLGTMAAVSAGPDKVAAILGTVDDVWVANLNAPDQTILSGTKPGIGRAVERFQAAGVAVRSLPVGCAFHSPIVAPAQARLAGHLAAARFHPPRVPVYSNTTAGPHGDDPRAIAVRLADHLIRPVRFAEQIEAMYAAGARIFVEVGPRQVLTGLTRANLGTRPHLAVPLDPPGRHGLTQLLHAIGTLAVHGVPLDPAYLYRGRPVRRLNLNALALETRSKPLSASSWLVNGARARPAHQPVEPLPLAPLAAIVHQGIEAAQSPGATPSTNGSAPLAYPNGHAHAAPTNGHRPPPADRTRSVGPPAPAPIATDDEAGIVVQSYISLMDRVVQSQRDLMLSYLQGAPALPARDDGGPAPLAIAATPPIAAPVPVVEAHPAALPVATTATEAAGLQGREELVRALLAIVSERTGYPPEMLDLDVDIEAELGIDSIKRVEILGAFQRSVLPADRQLEADAMEQLTGLKTLAGVIGWLERAVRPVVDEPTGPSPAPAVAEAASPTAGRIERLKLVAVEAPAVHDGPIPVATDRVILITADQGGIAEIVAESLIGRGHAVAIVRQGIVAQEYGPRLYEADLASPESVDRLVALIRQLQGPIGGLIHLGPLGRPSDLDQAVEAIGLAEWRARIGREVKGLFHLVRAAAADLRLAAGGPSGLVVAATGMGGQWAAGEPSPGGTISFPAHGAIAGLLKTLALEWPGALCKAVDLDPTGPAADLAGQIVREIGGGDRTVQVGYRGGRRWTLERRSAPLDESAGADRPGIEPGAVVLVTGGARGITAEVAIELARRYRPTLVLTGRSPDPGPRESPITEGLDSAQSIKAALIRQRTEAGESVALARVEAAYRRLIQDREIRANLARIAAAGAVVRYESVDVGDEPAMTDLVARVRREFGRIDGAIHGAGVIEDRRIDDKTPDSFNRVFDAKADGAFILSRVLDPESLRFFVLFSSAAGAFGNPGQADYAAANELLNKLARDLDGRWPGRVVAIGWGPWAKTGMVSDELRRRFDAQGIALIDVAAGCDALDRELRLGAKGEPEVIVAGGSWGDPSSPVAPAVGPGATDPGDSSFPLLRIGTEFQRGGGVVELLRAIDPSYDLYLNDHRLDGKPVLPMAMAMELMAEAVMHEWGDLRLVGVRDLRVLKGIVLDHGPRTIRLVARAAADPPTDRLGADVTVEITDPDRPGYPLYRATVELGDRVPDPPAWSPPSPDALHPFPRSLERAYSEWLFHGPLFQNINALAGIGESEIAGMVAPSTPRGCLEGVAGGAWQVDPVVVDCGLQLVLLWARARHDMTPLPSGFSRYRQFGPLAAPSISCHVQSRLQPGTHTILSTLTFVGPGERVLAILENLEGPCSRALNRLAGASHAR